MRGPLARYVLSGALVVAGAIHVLPVFGVLGVSRLEALYGVELSDPNLIILLRHRAVLFGLFGAFLLVAAFRKPLQGAALIAGLVSVASFLWFAVSVGGYNAGIGRVVIADIVALVALLAGAIAHVWRGRVA